MTQSDALISLEKQLFFKERELRALLEITQAITHDANEADLYKIYQFTLIGQLGMRRLALYVLDDKQFRLKAGFGTALRVGSCFAPIALPQRCQTQPCPVPELALGPEWAGFELLVPVRQQETVQAFVFIGTTNADYATREALGFLETLSNILLGAVANRRLARQREASMMAEAAVRREIEIAQQVQQLLFPQHLPNNKSFAVQATYLPHTEIGGDYYDVVELSPDRLLVCVADVSGKGVPASLLMSNFQAGLRTLLRQGTNLATIVHELNHLLFRNSGGEKFITAFLGLYDRRTQVLEYVNAGHNDPLLLPDRGPAQRLHEGTVMLGIMPELPMLKVGLARVPPHSLLFLYTDGLTEVFDDQQNEYGEDGVLALLARSRYLPLTRLHQELLHDIRHFNTKSEKFADDVTLLSLRVK
ncbi:MAG: PP2C family protein-serine/threonine phosphatase [Janthinobacterium lividum]